MLGGHIGDGSHWLKRFWKSPRISRIRHATSGASASRLSRARGSSALCMTPRLPVHSKKRVRMSLSLSGPKVSWSSSPKHAVVGALMRWLRWRNTSLARALNEGSAGLCMGGIFKYQPPASPGFCYSHARFRLIAIVKWSQKEPDALNTMERIQVSSLPWYRGGEIQGACGWHTQVAVLSHGACRLGWPRGAAQLRLVTS